MTKSLGFLVSFLFVLTACSSKSAVREQKSDYFLRIGTSYLMSYDYPAALKSLLEAERLNSDNPIIQNNLGLAYVGLKRHDLAVPHLRKAVQLHSKYTDARNNLGGVYVLLGKYDDAIEALRKAEDDLTYEHQDRVQTNLGVAYFYKKQYKKAREALEKSLSIRKNDCQTMKFYGRSLYELTQYKDAADSFDMSVEFCKEPNSEEPRFYGGLAYLKLQEKEKAAGRFREVINLYPKGEYAQKAQELLEILK